MKRSTRCPDHAACNERETGTRVIADAVGARGATFVNPSAVILRFLELMDQSGLRSEIACG